MAPSLFPVGSSVFWVLKPTACALRSVSKWVMWALVPAVPRRPAEEDLVGKKPKFRMGRGFGDGSCQTNPWKGNRKHQFRKSGRGGVSPKEVDLSISWFWNHSQTGVPWRFKLLEGSVLTAAWRSGHCLAYRFISRNPQVFCWPPPCNGRNSDCIKTETQWLQFVSSIRHTLDL